MMYIMSVKRNGITFQEVKEMKKALIIVALVLTGFIGFKAGQSEQVESNEVIEEINYQLDVACGADEYCRDVFVDC